MTKTRLRAAHENDLGALVRIEEDSFRTDQLSRRALRRFMHSPTAFFWVAEGEGGVVGYALVIFRRNTALARLYSMAVDPAWRRQGIGQALLMRAEEGTLDFGAPILRLEVNPDNAPAIGLYRKNGYGEFALYPDYYDDHSPALRMEKVLVPQSLVRPSPLHFYHQTLPFTCGPASLMMAMNALNPSINMDRTSEIALWREATTIFMTSGHGGCGPLGLGLAAYRRGFDVEIWTSSDGPLFVNTVRKAANRKVVELVHDDFAEQAKKAGIPVLRGPFGVREFEARASKGQMALILISQYRIYGDKIPHWVVVSGFDERYVYVTDPDIGEDDEPYTGSDCVSVPILRHEFDLMVRYGRNKLQAAIFLHRRS
ncbi:GNAT family N-acetyltransferase/peptidase C39 family protein [Thalassospira sp.]|uniref:GNAT family N-acetyltransferase/peptidase C39 family protein n=1 Tax=Thalassospira sp. TaxID=1912094 RepID=UPI00273342DC|nr:GNAT family N-acetyltransferase/peptidase C39 family protein [Thalassospira sp.]MDP2697681.1 GNAT family N-acetyltransferase/peptidase C39 family protein [Thalassospira sp.]